MAKEYHEIWVRSHRLATMEFLEQAMAAGFDIHHADGDHGNNDPENLVLIYSGDHAKLHRGVRMMAERGEKSLEAKRTKGRGAYEMRLSGVSWRDVGVEYGSRAIELAKWYARSGGKAWPIPVPRVLAVRKRVGADVEAVRPAMTADEREVMLAENPLMPGELRKKILGR